MVAPVFSITNTVETILPGLGVPTTVASRSDALTATATKTLALPASVRSGLLRIKFSGPNAATTAQFAASVTDGVTVFEILPKTAVTTAGDSAEITRPFILDTACNSCSVTATLAGSTHTGTLSFEVCGNP